jgi:hypothetical protein
MGQWRYSLVADRLTAAMAIAKRVYSLAEEQNDPTQIIGACLCLAATHYCLGNFEPARGYAARGVQIWRSGSAQAPVKEFDVPVVLCLCNEAILLARRLSQKRVR